MITESNIYEKGVLISLHMGGYAGRKKMDKEQLKDQPTEIVRGVHDLFDKDFKELLQRIWGFDSEVRSTIKNKAVPFPVDGIYFLKMENLGEAITFLDEQKIKRTELIKEAVAAYDGAIKQFKEKYPAFYKAAQGKYITKDDFESRFHFGYQLMRIAPPDKNNMISPEIYKQEISKFKENVEAMKKDVLATIAQTLLETTKRLKEQCSDGKPNQRTLNNLNKFLSQVDEVYSEFIDREDIKSVITNIRASVLGIDANALREGDDFKREFKNAISKVADEIKALPDIPLKRSIEF
jgi:hypothetical protein